MTRLEKFCIGLAILGAAVTAWLTPSVLSAQIVPSDPQRQCFAPGPGDDNSLADAAEASANDLSEAIVWLHRGGERPTQADPQVALLQQAINRTLCTIKTDWRLGQ